VEEGRATSYYWQKAMPNNTVRFYNAEITEDLCDNIIYCQWGKIGTSRGGIQSYPAEKCEQACQKLDEIKRVRL
jgi:predicted DNA-binding WGR domain protein